MMMHYLYFYAPGFGCAVWVNIGLSRAFEQVEQNIKVDFEVLAR
jgi:hypothetical protein